jgi:hypothetical protein
VPSPNNRRRFLQATALAGVVLASGGAAWLMTDDAPVEGFPDFAAVRAWLARVGSDHQATSLTPWPLPHVLEHLAQSIEFSLRGYPQARPAWFQHSAGALAFAVFAQRGRMQHGLTEPIPGAPALSAIALRDASHRLHAALQAFETHTGPLHPHFAYGALDKAAYARAHLLHVADHARQVRVA